MTGSEQVNCTEWWKHEAQTNCNLWWMNREKICGTGKSHAEYSAERKEQPQQENRRRDTCELDESQASVIGDIEGDETKLEH